ncbi:carboxypeptidase-like regulatory domain-containing protein [Candidatus Omnitrophota bacterium]
MHKAKIAIVIVILAAALSVAYNYGALSQEDEKWIVGRESSDKGFDLSGYIPDPDLGFSFEGKTFHLDKPSEREGADIWVPAKEFFEKMDIVFIKLSDESFTVIGESGLPLTLKAGDTDCKFRTTSYLTVDKPPALYKGEFFIALAAAAKVLDIAYKYDDKTNTVAFPREAAVEELSTFTVAKPRVEVEEKPKPKPTLIRDDKPKDIREEHLPSEYRPDIHLVVNNNLTYLLEKAADSRTRQTEWNITGRAFDYTVDGHFRLRDIRSGDKQRFKEDGEFLAFYKKDLWLKFLDNNFTLPYVRSQSQSYFGGEVQNIYGPLKSTFVYGEIDNTVTGPAAIGSIRFFGDLYSIREEYTDPREMFRTAGTFVFIENEAETQGKSSQVDYPRQNLVFMTDSTVNLYEGFSMDYAHALSKYTPDNRVNSNLIDDNWRWALDVTQDRYYYKAAYEHVGEQYASLAIPNTYQDYQGWNFTTGFVPSKNWRINVDGRLSNNNVERDPRLRKTFNRSYSMGTSLSLPWRQSLSSSYSTSETLTKGGDLDATGSRTESVRVDYSNSWGNMTLQGSYNHYFMHPFQASATTGSWSDLVTVSVFNYYPELLGSYARFYQSYRKQKSFAANTYTTETFNTSVGGRLNILRNLSLNTDWRVVTTRRESWNWSDNAMMTWAVGGEFKQSPVTTFNMDFTLANWDIYKRKTMLPKNYTVLFRVQHTGTISTPEKWGKVRVLIYRDLNSNGQHDNGEPGLRNVRAYVSDGRAAFTDEKGVALISKVVPGNRDVKVDITTLPLEESVRGMPVQLMKVEPLKTANVEFPIVKTGTVRGRVYLDADGDGKFRMRMGDEPLPNVRIYLTPGDRDTLSFSDGTYLMDYVYPGDYEVCVDKRNVPAEYRLNSREKIKIRLKGGGKAKNIDFFFKPRPVKIDVFE